MSLKTFSDFLKNPPKFYITDPNYCDPLDLDWIVKTEQSYEYEIMIERLIKYLEPGNPDQIKSIVHHKVNRQIRKMTDMLIDRVSKVLFETIKGETHG